MSDELKKGVDLLGEIFKRELLKELEKEVSDPDYKPQEDYQNCLDRSRSLMEPAYRYTAGCLGLATALHRGNIHNEDTALSEAGELESSLEIGDVEEIKALWWWNN